MPDLSRNMLGLIQRLVIGPELLCLMLATAPAFAQIISVSPGTRPPLPRSIGQGDTPVFFERLANPQPGDDGFLIRIRYDD